MSEVKLYCHFEKEGQKATSLSAETICSDPLFRQQFAAWEQRVIMQAWNSLIAKVLGSVTANRFQAAVNLHQETVTERHVRD
jgi:hypothetical protein